MKALSTRQPWAWLILNVGPDVKDIENRKWRTWQRGRVLVHAAKGLTRYEYDQAVAHVWSLYRDGRIGRIDVPAFEALERGGIVGSVEIVDCVSRSPSPWFEGPFGFKLANPEQLPFTPLKGALGFFEVPDALIPPSACKVCGCTWTRACAGGCYWVAPGLCSACAPAQPRTAENPSHTRTAP